MKLYLLKIEHSETDKKYHTTYTNRQEMFEAIDDEEARGKSYNFLRENDKGKLFCIGNRVSI